jgi:hypothetical protein
MPLPYRSSFDSPIIRLRVLPDDPAAVTAARPRGTRRPHTDAKVAEVRRLIETTVLTYGEIAAQTGVGRASICRWTRDGGWQRHPFAPRATDTIPRARASAKLKRRTLAARLQALAERYVREMEETPGADLDKLAEALELMKMAKVAARPRKRGKKAGEAEGDDAAASGEDEHYARAAMRELRAGGVETYRVGDEALEDFVASRAPLPERHKPARSHRARVVQEHARMMEPYSDG